MAVLIKNARVSIIRASDNTLLIDDDPVNMQKVSPELPNGQMQGRGIDETPMYAIRVSNTQTGIVPTQGDIVQVKEFTGNPELFGRWYIHRVESNTLLKALRLYVKREVFVIGNGN